MIRKGRKSNFCLIIRRNSKSMTVYNFNLLSYFYFYEKISLKKNRLIAKLKGIDQCIIILYIYYIVYQNRFLTYLNLYISFSMLMMIKMLINVAIERRQIKPSLLLMPCQKNFPANETNSFIHSYIVNIILFWYKKIMKTKQRDTMNKSFESSSNGNQTNHAQITLHRY